MKTPTTGLVAVLGASILLAAGCGSSSKTTSSTTAASATPTTSQQSSTASTSTSESSAPAVLVDAKHSGKLGTVLAAGPKKLTVYMFEGDKGEKSSCSGTCASVWPPVTTGASPTTSGAAHSADLGTITRSDGTTQVTYKGHPLYYFAKDKDSGDAYGQGVHGFGADWYVLSSSGKKVDEGSGGNS